MFREYIQNACDAVDAAIASGILASGGEQIDVKIDPDSKSIEISDNGNGIPKTDFVRVLSDIANSDKERGKDKGFRGIGRLCGLAYCAELQFISTAKDEDTVSIMTWDAATMRKRLNDNQKHSADEVLNEILKTTANTFANPDEHYFKVVMTGIRKECRELLDAQAIRDYLSFEIPVPYDSAFIFYTQIYDHAKQVGKPIDEYRIYVNDEQIFKKYRSRFLVGGKADDEVRELAFHDFYDENDQLLAWMWFGLSSLKRQIKPENKQRGLRLRKGNIQIGESGTLRKLFKDARGNEYFIGEVFAVHPELIPNARRDYFNSNPIRTVFEEQLREFFVELWKLCNLASDDRSAYRNIQNYHAAVTEYKQKAAAGFTGSVDKEALETELEEKKKRAETAKRKIDKRISIGEGGSELTARVREIVKLVAAPKKLTAPLPILPAEWVGGNNKERGDKTKYLSNELSQYSKETRKVVSQIYDLVSENAPEIAQSLIAKIHIGLKQPKKE
jgi:molecular chaperone HtpG